MINRIYQKPVFIETKGTIVRKTLKSIDVDDLEQITDLDKLIKFLQKIKKDNPGLEKYKIEVHKDYDSDYYLSSLEIIGEKQENDEEYEKRKQQYLDLLHRWDVQEIEDKKLAEKKEKELYNKLKKKFEK